MNSRMILGNGLQKQFGAIILYRLQKQKNKNGLQKHLERNWVTKTQRENGLQKHTERVTKT